MMDSVSSPEWQVDAQGHIERTKSESREARDVRTRLRRPFGTGVLTYGSTERTHAI